MSHPSSSHPVSPPERIGPYRIHSVLGQGGMGVVYRGQHQGSGASVAIKTVRSANEVMLGSIRREIYALGRIRHPGVVRIVDQGIFDGLPWYAMELLTGTTLATYIKQQWSSVHGAAATLPMDRWDTLDGPEVDGGNGGGGPVSSSAIDVPHDSLMPVLAMVHGLCAPLAYLHGQGVVHRDLKPENVFLRDHQPVLVDLGVAGQFGGARGREVLSVEGHMMGTLPFMAPEQIRGELVDARADLYSLGCILYQCLSGRLPFVSSSTRKLIQLHLEFAPAPPSRWRPDIPGELDQLVMQLLAKRPQDRLGYAEDVARALEALGVKPGPSRPLPAPSPYLYRPKLVGRERVIERLIRTFERVREQKRGAMVFVGGESGVGKTRLIMELAREVTLQQAMVVTGQCLALSHDDASIKAAPLQPFRALLRGAADRARSLGPAETERIFAERGKVLEPYEPGLADLPHVHDHPPPAPLPAQRARQRLFRCLRDVLLALAHSAPLVLILDDLQWADELSLEFLARLAREDLENRPVLVMGAYRLDEMRPELAAVVSSAGVDNQIIGRLNADSAGAMACDMLALREVPDDFAGFLFEQSDGNPFFIGEYLRVAIENGVLARDHNGRWRLDALDKATAIPLPRSLADLIHKRLHDLDPRSLALVQFAAVLGRELDPVLLMHAAGVDEDALMEALERLRLALIFEEAERGRLRFVHDKIREIAYDEIAAAERRTIHLRVARALEAAQPAADMSSVLAHHFARAGEHARASLYFDRAGDRARDIYANNEAVSYYRAAIDEAGKLAASQAESPAETLAGEPPHAHPGQVHEKLGDLLAIMGQQDQARAAYSEALAHDPGDQATEASQASVRSARLHRKIGKSWETHLRHEQALAAYAASERVLGVPGAADHSDAWWHEWMQTQTDRLEVYYWAGQLDALRQQVDTVRPFVEKWAASRQQAQFFYGLMLMQIRVERYRASDDTLAYMRSYLAAARAAGDPALLASSQFSGGFINLWRGDLDAAESYLDHAIDAGERMGNVILLSRSLTYKTIICRMRHRSADARAVALRSQEVARAGHMRDYLGAAEANLAWVARCEGEPEAHVIARCHAALGHWQEMAAPFPFEWLARVLLLAAHLDEDRVAEAMAEARALTDIKQYRFPDALDDHLARALAAWERDQASVASRELRAFIAGAGTAGYL